MTPTESNNKQIEPVEKSIWYQSLENKLFLNFVEQPGNELLQDARWWINENAELEVSETIQETTLSLTSLLNEVSYNFENINWVTKRFWKENCIDDNWVFMWVNSLKLEEIIHSGQKLSIFDKNWKQRNVIWWKSKSWEVTYIYDWTKTAVKIFDWMRIWSYSENVYKTNILETKANQLWFTRPILSAPTYKNPKTWVTLCSRTARENLQKLWIKFPVQWATARDSFRLYWKQAEKFPPKYSSKSVADLYLDASSANKEYWHRAIWVKINGEWFVLDPYYTKTRNPVPANEYLTTMKWRYNRKIWWCFTLA